MLKKISKILALKVHPPPQTDILATPLVGIAILGYLKYVFIPNNVRNYTLHSLTPKIERVQRGTPMFHWSVSVISS